MWTYIMDSYGILVDLSPYGNYNMKINPQEKIILF